MPGNGSIGGFRGTVTDRNGIWDLTASVLGSSASWMAHAALGLQFPRQFTPQHATGLQIEADVNRLVGHALSVIVRVSVSQPTGDLLRRPALPKTPGDLMT